MDKIGAHLSISKSIANIFNIADELNINYIQCFTASNLRFSVERDYPEKVLEDYFNNKKRKDYKVFSHASYLINLASDDDEIRKKSELIILSELYRCNLLEIEGITIHPGSSKDREAGLKKISESIIRIIDKFPKKHVPILIELSAGGGSTLPVKVEEAAMLYEYLHSVKSKIGFTVDTCHVHASGYNLAEEESQKDFWSLFDKEIGIDLINLIHLNDSKKDCGSRLDRHENIGNGTIGINGFKYLFSNKKLNNIPKILETPYDSTLLDCKEDINKIRKLN